MTPATRRIARITFWVLFLAGTVVAARVLWVKADPLRNHPWLAPWWMQRQVDALASSHRPTAMRAWLELERCFLSKWSAYDWVVWRVKENIWQKDDPPIHFRLERSGYRFTPTDQEPSRQCRTVNETLMAVLYQEPVWKTAHTGDWRKWWEANWTYFPNRHLSAKPSGPEDPHTRRRR